MSTAQRALHGDFGRIALLEMDKPLVRHVHSECHVLLKAMGADTRFSVRDRTHELTERTAVLVNSGEPHYYAHQPDAAPTLILALYIEPGWLAERQPSLRTSAHPGFFPEPSVTLTPDMQRLADALIAEMLMQGTLARQRFESLLFDLLVLIFERHSEWRYLRRHMADSPSGPFDARIRHANEYMLAHLTEKLDVAALARECGLSRAHFFALYRRHTLITPQMFVNMQKMRRACGWLASERRDTLGNLADSLGFSDQGHFTRFFQRHLGAAPAQYRRVLDRYEPSDRRDPTACRTGQPGVEEIDRRRDPRK